MTGAAQVEAALRDAGCVHAAAEARLLVSATSDPAELHRLVARRVGGEPLEHVLGYAWFAEARVEVDPGVFVPRRRTELLVRRAAAALGAAGPHPVAVDLCCGSGAVALALARSAPGLRVHAVDLDPAAVACARRNLAPVGGEVHLGDLDEPLPAGLAGRVSVVTANAPYVPTSALELLPREARHGEPRLALDGGPDGLDVLHRVVAAAPRWLAPSGSLLVESSSAQAPALVAAMAAVGLDPTVVGDDDLEATVVVGAVTRGERGRA